MGIMEYLQDDAQKGPHKFYLFIDHHATTDSH